MTKQAMFTIVTPLKDGTHNHVRNILLAKEYFGVCPITDEFGFSDISTVHFASIFIYDDPEDGWSLVFESNIDGSIESYLDSFLSNAEKKDNGKLLREIYGHCKKCDDPNLNELKSYMMDHLVLPVAGFVTGPGLTRDQILEDAKLYELVNKTLGSGPADLKGQDINAVVLTAIETEGNFQNRLAPAESDEKPSLIQKIANSIQLAFNAILFLAIGLINLIRERTAIQDTQRPDLDHIKLLNQREDIIPTNHMVSIVHVHRDLSRQLGKRFAFGLLRNLVTLFFNKGWLGPINSIHFAHWAKLNNGRRLMFVSNYGSTWDSYLDDFTLKANKGLTLSWAHGIGFPKSWLMLGGGAAKGPEFTDWARRSMVPTLVWYHAYPKVSASNIHRNRKLRASLKALETNVNDTNWLSLMGSSDA